MLGATAASRAFARLPSLGRSVPHALQLKQRARAMAIPRTAEARPGLTNAPLLEELKAAAYAVRLASGLCQMAQQQLSESEKVDKLDDSPVTVADYAAQAVVAWALSRSPAATQGAGLRLSMMAEENTTSLRQPEGLPMLLRITDLVKGVIRTEDPSHAAVTPKDVLSLIDLGESDGGSSGRHWVLDPIDGTRGFVGMRQYSCCLALIQDGVVELGLLGCPNLPQGKVDPKTSGDSNSMARGLTEGHGVLFLAHRGHGSYKASMEGRKDLTDVEPISMLESGHPLVMESFETRHSDHSFTSSIATEMGIAGPTLRMDSQVKYGLMSRGDSAAIFMRFPPASYTEKIWDHAPGFVIVEEAGGLVTDASGTRLDFSKGRYLALDRGIIAAPRALHARVIQAIQVVEARKTAP